MMEMKYKPNIKEVIERYKAFWDKDKLDRIPIRIRFPVGSLQSHESYLEGKNEKERTEEKWEDIVLDPERYFQYWDEQLKQRIELLDDSIPTAPTDLGPALMGGIMGAEIKFENGTSWSEHPLKNWDDMDKYSFTPDNKWVKLIKNMTKYFLKNSQGKFAVGLANLMGPADILTCLRGPNSVCLDLYEHPQELRRLSEKCVEAYIKTINIQFDLIPRYYDGTCEGYMIWTPGRSNWLTCDISSILSPELYRNFFMEYDQQIVDELDNCWMHVHSGGAYMIEEFVKLKGLRGIQIVNDAPAGPSIKELLPLMKKVQENHCLILRKFNIEEIKNILGELSPAGLFIDTQCSSLEEAKKALNEWTELTKNI